jgi:hypothetical protein
VAWLFLEDAALRGSPAADAAHGPPPAPLVGDLDCLALLLSAICHDLEHPGTTNAYQVNTASLLALRYNDASVLENHHCAAAFALLERAGILLGMARSDFKALRKLMVAAILATDMSVHKDLLARVASRAKGAEEGPGGGSGGVGGGFSRDSPEDRQLLVAFLLHCADLCNPLLPPAMSQRIANELSQEFARQAALERAASLPVTVMLADTDSEKAKMECGFIDFVVKPLFVALVGVAPTLGARCLGLIKRNREAWSQLIDAAEADAAAA